MKKSEFTCAQSLAWATVLSLLFLSIIGSTAWAKGPPKPPPPSKYEFKIWIGQESSDVFLSNPSFLTAESYVDTCGWYYPYKKGANSGSWSADLNELLLGSTHECGDYDLSLEGVFYQICAQSFSIHHGWAKPGRYDFWEFYIGWGWNKENPEDYSEVRVFRVWTDTDFDTEGAYNTIDEVWEVDFNGANWELISFNPDGTGYRTASGTIMNGFSVTIAKGPAIS